MPTYSYKCFDCGHQFEEFQKISDAPISKCPACGKDEVKRLISATAFHLKGAGWYKTDYAASSTPAAGSGTANADAAKNDTSTSSASSPSSNAESKTPDISSNSSPPAKTESNS